MALYTIVLTTLICFELYDECGSRLSWGRRSEKNHMSVRELLALTPDAIPLFRAVTAVTITDASLTR